MHLKLVEKLDRSTRSATTPHLTKLMRKKMAPKSSRLAVFLLIFFLSSASSFAIQDSFINCLLLHSPNSKISQIMYTPDTTYYYTLLNSTIQNLRFASTATAKPLLILTPTNYLEVQASVICSKSYKLTIRVRSGGHDYEGLSYRSVKPSRFIVVDVMKLRSVHVDAELGIAHVQSGATLGELYYEIARKDGTLGFPAGICPTVCIGGHVSGGGFGPLMRKYGLAADNVIDALLVDVNGRLLDGESMGEDLFWAIRGGGGASFGIIVSWKLRLVPVPRILSAFNIHMLLQQEAAVQLLNRWQYIAHKLHEDLFLKIAIEPEVKDDKRRPQVVFKSLFLGNCTALRYHLKKDFPELGVKRGDCREMSWIQSVLYFGGYTNGETSTEVLLDRTLQPKTFYKAKLDYLKDPIPVGGWNVIWQSILDDMAGSIDIDPQGGRMSAIGESETPYAHRKGYLYNLQYFVQWKNNGDVATQMHLDWASRWYKRMSAYVSKHPRAAYVNFRDLDLGQNEEGNTSYSEAKVWGEIYFGGNFRRLALVKGETDPEQVFWSEQSIPPLVVTKGKVHEGLVSDN